ncbi:MAG: helix-turn-helix domain-containing protein [Saprospiraceae bacterium]|nr:helix-turn-helix domain-containing protein [Saprospiraceae bacterium]
MKVVSFTIPKMEGQSFHFQDDVLPRFYEHYHRHREYQLMMILEGEGTLVTSGKMMRFKRGDFFIIGPDMPHLFRSDPEYFEGQDDLNVHSYSIFFEWSVMVDCFHKIPEMGMIFRFLKTSLCGLKYDGTDSERLISKMEKVRDCHQGYRWGAFIELLQYLAEEKNWIKINPIPLVSFSDHEGMRMDDIYQYSLSHYKEEITLEEIAAVACMAPQSFCRYFKKHTRKTYTVFIHELRIAEACKLLSINKERQIDMIAYECGFNHVVTFNRVFKSIMGCTPGTYRKEMK